MSDLPPKADISLGCPLCANSGHHKRSAAVDRCRKTFIKRAQAGDLGCKALFARTGPDKRGNVGLFFDDQRLTMGRIYWPFLIFGLLFVSPTFGQYVPVIQACNRDVVQFCAPDRPNGMRLAKCTQTHFQDFTESCKAALVKI